ncbi:hypothetical protein TWF481_010298 [Arthrobotrys musiformis]|uniref:Nephrocystin 3-like N-terminal domain-containing protein n=1 Tax=Arthrobotrys musiformis TaxID=47236 RepID=A0AAV9W0I2_9PEZI
MSATAKRTISGYDRPMVSATVENDREDGGLDTIMEDDTQPIRLMARDCNELFEKLMSPPGGPSESEISTFVQEYHGRFDAWTSFLGVFASGNASLDYRFQRHPGLQDMVIRLLDVLRRNLFLVKVYQASETSQDLAPDAPGDANPKRNFDSNISIAFSSIEETITRLNKLGIAIRLSSRSTSIARARTFAAEHPDLIRVNEFEERAHIALQSLYPNASEIVRQQLADSMADRYAKLQYEIYRMNARRIEIQPNLPVKNATLISGEQKLTELESPQTKSSGNHDAPSPFKVNPAVIINFPASSIDTTRLRENLREDNAEVPRAQPKPPRTITVFANQYREPPLPTFDDGHEYTHCNWCSQRIDRSLTRQKRGGLIEWSDIGRHHYKNDLQPYVCVAEGCCKSRPTYSSSRDWFKHMMSTHSESWAYNIHSRSSWLCPEKHENDSVYVFSTRDELQDHILLRHGPPADSEAFERLIDSAKQHGNENLHLVSSCPLCFFRLETEAAWDDEPAPVESTLGGNKRVVSHGKPEKRVKLSAHAKVTTSWEMGSHVAEHLHYLMIVTLQLMSAMDGTSYGDEGAESMDGDSSSRISAPGHDDWNDRLDELPSEVQGSIDWSDINEEAPSTPGSASSDGGPVPKAVEKSPPEADDQPFRGVESKHLPLADNPDNEATGSLRKAMIDLSSNLSKLILRCRDGAQQKVKVSLGDLEILQRHIGQLQEVLSLFSTAVLAQVDGTKTLSATQLNTISLAIIHCDKQVCLANGKFDEMEGRKPRFQFFRRDRKWPLTGDEMAQLVAALEECPKIISLVFQDELKVGVEVVAFGPRDGVDVDLSPQVPIGLDIRSLDLGIGLPRAQDAEYNSHMNQYLPMCFPGTREDLLLDIMQWADDPHGRLIFWLNGAVGTGKSTISRTVAHSLENKGQLGASFFFRRGQPDLSSCYRFFTTIAVQLSEAIPDLKPHLGGAIGQDPEIGLRSLETQFNSLVLEPLTNLNLPHKPTFIVVIDALDECKEGDDITFVLRLLTQLERLEGARIRIFLTSRPELPIRLGFRELPRYTYQSFTLQNIPQAVIKYDISLFLQAQLAQIGQNSGFGSDWPGKETINRLTQISVPLFACAAAICRFVGSPGLSPELRLRGLSKELDTGKVPGMKEIYLPLMSETLQVIEYRSVRNANELIHNLTTTLGFIVILAEPLSVSALASLIGINREDISRRLSGLHSVLNVPPDSSDLPIKVIHPSFKEFIVNPENVLDSRLWVDEKKAHSSIMEHCLNHLSLFLGQNICILETPGTLRRDLDSVRISIALFKDLQYACLYWPYHYEKRGEGLSDEPGTVPRNYSVNLFLYRDFLHWIEALSLLGQASKSVAMIDVLRSLIDEPEESRFLDDAKSLLLENLEIIDQAPLQIYYSALIFGPEDNTLVSRFQGQFLRSIRKIPRRFGVTEIPGLHEAPIQAVVFSSDGRWLASLSNASHFKLWEAAGVLTLAYVISGHGGSARAAAFSPNGELLATGLESHDVAIRDLTNDFCVAKSLEGHSDVVSAVAWSSDGKLFASGSRDKVVILWDVATWTMMGQQEVRAPVGRLSFTSDGGYLETDREVLAIPPNAPYPVPPLSQRPPGFIGVRDDWITYDDRNFVWLPPKYRGSCSAINGKLFAIGGDSGTVHLFELLEDI